MGSGDSTLSLLDSIILPQPPQKNSSFPKVLFLDCHGWAAMSTAHGGFPAEGALDFASGNKMTQFGLHREVNSCCVFDCYPKSSGLCNPPPPSLIDIKASSPVSKRPLV